MEYIKAIEAAYIVEGDDEGLEEFQSEWSDACRNAVDEHLTQNGFEVFNELVRLARENDMDNTADKIESYLKMETVANTSIPAHRIPMPSQNFAKNSLNMVLLTFLLLGAVDALSGVWKRSQTLLANIFPARRTFRIGALFNPIKGAP